MQTNNNSSNRQSVTSVTGVVTASGPAGANPRRLSVRVARGTQLTPSSHSSSHKHRGLGLVSPYVVVEVDEPGQRSVTAGGDIHSMGSGAEWNEEFIL